jgi:hypothetical protein
MIGKFSDGNCRQLLIRNETMNSVLGVIYAMEGTINVCETIIEGMAIEERK